MFEELVLSDNIEVYKFYYNHAHYKSIYHHIDYLLAEEAAENGKIYLYIYHKNEKFIILPSVKRKINDIKEFDDLKENYYDLKTPHEYSGVIAFDFNFEDIKEFYIQLGLFCKKHHIIFSFLRFNPYNEEYKAAEGYHVIKNAEQVWMNCQGGNIDEGFTRSLKRDLKIAIREQLICKEVEKNHDNRKIFEELYNKAMRRIEAKPFFYFSKIYFERLLNAKFTSLYFAYDCTNSKVLAASIVLKDTYNKRAYYHLSCRSTEKVPEGTMKLLIAYFSYKLQMENYNCIHLGSGSTKGLQEFKARFSRDRVDYYIGYNIFDNNIYQKLSDKFKKMNPEMDDIKYFPLYRCKE